MIKITNKMPEVTIHTLKSGRSRMGPLAVPKSQRLTTGTVSLRILAAWAMLFIVTAPAAASSGSFDQNDWTGGVSAVTAAHPGDQTGWQVYSAKDADLNAAADLQLNSVSDAETRTDPQDFSVNLNTSRTQQTHTDFAAGSVGTGALLVGTGVTLDFASRSPAWTANSAWNTYKNSVLTWVAAGDLDGDGDYDLLIGDTYYYGLRMLTNTGTVTSPVWGGGPATGVGGGLAKPALADLDGDGDLDLMVGSVYTGTIAGYENTGDSSNPVWTSHSAWSWGGSTRPALADLDGDGDYDLMADNHGIENIGDSSNPVWAANSAWDAPVAGSPALADLDGDGDFDLLIGGSDGITHAYENTGDSSSPIWTANPAWDLPDVGTYAAPTFADLDDDGDPDVMLAYGSTGNILGFENTGTGTYQPSGSFVSSVIDTGGNQGFTTLDYTVTQPANTTITFDVRAGDTATPDSGWTAWQPDIANGGDISALGAHRYFQYRANLATTDNTVTPKLQGVTVNYVNYPYSPGAALTVNGGVRLNLDHFSPATEGQVASPTSYMYLSTPVVSGNYLYAAGDVGNSNDRFLIFDVSDPANPTIAAQVGYGDRVLALDAVGNYAYLALQSKGLGVVDVSDPTSPVTVATYATPGTTCRVHIAGNYAYVDDFTNLLVIDISNPAAPTLAGSFATGGTTCDTMTTSGHYLYRTDGANGLMIFDISDPTTPVLVTTYPKAAKDVEVSGNLAYVVGGTDFYILDVTDPAAPVLLSSTPDGGSSNKNQITVDNNIAYISIGSLQIYDVSNPAQPALLTTLQYPSNPYLLQDLTMAARHVYAAYANGPSAGLYVISLGPYSTSGSYTSSVIDLDKHLGFTTLDYTATIPASTSLTVDVRAGDTPQPDGTWSAWQTAVANGGDISGLPASRYVQYRVNLTTTDTTVTPTLDDISFNFTRYALTASLTSSAYDSGDDANLIQALGWNENLPAGTDVRFQMRTAPDNGGTPGTWSGWLGPDGSSASYWNSANTFGGTCSGAGTISCTLPTTVRDGIDDRWLQYRVVTTTTDPSVTPDVTDVSISYATSVSAAGAITVTPTSGLVTAEDGSQATFSVVLDSAPSADVTIDLYSSDTSEGTISPSSVTFTNGNWSTPQTVTVTGQDDSVDDGDIAYSVVTTAAISADPAFNNLNPDDVSLTNTDNDTAGITVTPVSGLTTTEAGGSASFTVELDSQPLQDVSIALSSSNTLEGTVSPASLTFTAGNWNSPQTVTVTGVDDVTIDGDVNYTIVTAPATSADGLYSGIDASDVAVTNTDNDVAGVIITPATLTTSESGGAATFTVKLTARPASPVSFTLSSSDTTEGVVSLLSSSFSFNPDEWDTPQPGTVFGVNDALADGNVDYTIVTSPLSSSDPLWNGVNPADIPATNMDDDSHIITVTPTSGLTTSENGGTAQFTITLGSSPSADVTIPLSSSDTSVGVVTPSSVTFKPNDLAWRTNGGITVTITGVDNHVVSGDTPYTIITGPAVSADAGYDGIDPPDVSVINTDNEYTRSIIETNAAGATVSSVATGDINGDGLRDLILGSRTDSSGGKVRVYYGTASGYNATPDWMAVSNTSNTLFGTSVAAADVNGDGYDDVVIGTTYTSHVYVYYGSPSGPPDADGDGIAQLSDASWTATNDNPASQFGTVANAGDVNGDGYDDLIVGAYFYTNDQSYEGRVYAYYGSATGLSYTDCAGLGDGIAHPCEANWIAEGDQAYNFVYPQFGLKLASAGDVNGDGYDDIIIGASGYSNNAAFSTAEGRAFVYYGSAAGLPNTDCAGLGDGIAHICEASWMAETGQRNSGFGSAVASIGDINGDGYGDIAVGAPAYDDPENAEGRVFVYYGSASGLPDANSDGFAHLSDVSWSAEDDQADGRFGAAVATPGDINDDGYDDLIVGAYRFDTSASNSGKAFVYYGSATGLPYTDCAGLGDGIAHPCEGWSAEIEQAEAFFGSAVGSVGDLNGDGHADFYVSAPNFDDGQTDEGAAFIYLSHLTDTYGFTVTPTSGLTTSESGDTATFTVALSTPTTADVTIGLSSSNTAEGTVSPASLTFTTADWMKPQTVTVTGVNDTITDGDIPYLINFAPAVSTDSNYNGLNPPAVNVTNLDNDIPVTVSVTAASTPEAGSGSFTFARTGDTSTPLTVYYTVGGTATPGNDYTALSGSATIPAGNTSTSVTLQPVNDALVEGDETVIVTLSADPAYAIGAVGSDTATIFDDDTVGVLVFAGHNMETTENGGSATFTVKLYSQPSDNVTMSLSSSDPSEGSVAPSSLTFTPGNWASQQTVTVTGLDDTIVDGNINYSVVFGNTVSTDSNYSGIAVPDVTLVNLDNDNVANVSVSTSIPASVSEGSSTPAFFTLSRTGGTTNPLTVYYTVSGDAQPSVDYAALTGSATIPAGSSSVNVNVTPLQDTVAEPTENVTLSLASGSGYVISSPNSNTVKIIDDDTGGASSAPVANFQVDQMVAEGPAATATVTVILSGPALNPVTIPYTVGGTATPGTDHDASNGNIVINTGDTIGSTTFNVFDDGLVEANETVVFTMGTPTNARVGSRNTHTVTITDGNVAPEVSLTANQGGNDTHLITTGDGNVTVTAAVTDPGDTQSYDWSTTNATLLAHEVGGPSTTDSLVINPSGLVNGNFYAVRLTVTDSGTPPKSTSIDMLLKVDVAPALTTADSDQDGTSDINESYIDTDGDGIPDYLDPSTQTSNELLMNAAQGDTYIIRTDPGLTLKLGETAIAANSDGALVSATDIANYGGGEGQPGVNPTDTVPNTGGYFDFEISGLQQAGQSVQVVLPQLAPIPVGSVYRKYDPASGWRDYTLDAANGIASALGSPGVCPPPGDGAYTPGLTAGNYCIQLSVEDGGPNDMDGMVNYIVKDPGGTATVTVTGSSSTSPAASASPASSGGGTLDWLALLGLSLLTLLRRGRVGARQG